MNLDVLADRLGAPKTFRMLAVGDKPSRFDADGPRAKHVTTVSYADATAALKNSKFHAVLVDAHGDADAVARVINAGNKQSLKTIMVGQHHHEQNRLRTLMLGADGYYCAAADADHEFWKPAVGKIELRERIRQALDDSDDDDDDDIKDLVDRVSKYVLSNRPRGRNVGELVRHAVAAFPPKPAGKPKARVKQVANVTSRVIKEAVARTAGGEVGDPSDLYWNTRFPDHPEVLGCTPHRVQPDIKYQLETALEVAPADDESVAVVANDVIGKEVQFEIRAFGAELFPKGARKGQRVVTSPTFTCTETGTEPFHCKVRFTEQVGNEAILHLSLLVKGGTVASRDIMVGVEQAAPATPRRRTQAATTAVKTEAISDADEVQLRLVIDARRGALLDIDGVKPWSDAAAPDADSQAWEFGAKIASLLALSDASPTGDDPTSFALEDSAGAAYELAQIGAQLHSALFLEGPRFGAPDLNLTQLANAIRDRGSTTGDRPLLQIEAPDYAVPWGLLYDRSKDAGNDLERDNVDLAGFWGRRFDIQRVMFGGDQGYKRGANPLMQPVVGPAVPGGESHLAFVKALAKKKGARIANIVEDADGLLTWAKSGDATDLLYFFCHARPAAWIDEAGGLSPPKAPNESRFGFEASAPGGRSGVSLQELRLPSNVNERATNPVVIANACSTGTLDPETGSPFVEFFLKSWKAQAFVGTDWPVNGVFADRFGRLVLDRLLHHGESLRVAVRVASDKAFSDGNPFPVLYGIYGPPKVRFA